MPTEWPLPNDQPQKSSMETILNVLADAISTRDTTSGYLQERVAYLEDETERLTKENHSLRAESASMQQRIKDGMAENKRFLDQMKQDSQQIDTLTSALRAAKEREKVAADDAKRAFAQFDTLAARRTLEEAKAEPTEYTMKVFSQILNVFGPKIDENIYSITSAL